MRIHLHMCIISSIKVTGLKWIESLCKGLKKNLSKNHQNNNGL